MLSHQAPRQAGSALVMALGLLVVVVTFVAIASQSATSVSRDVGRAEQSIGALHAVNAVLARRSNDVSLLSNIGNAAGFSDWVSNLGYENYGIDYVGNYEVRWKIEPARTADYISPTATTADQVNFFINPNPDANAVTSGKQQPNAITYMYRIAADARTYHSNGASASTAQENERDIDARAQGATYVQLNHSPLFRYVIYSVQDDEKGDLELSHADSVTISGGVYSNGSIYLGGGLRVNDKVTQRGTFDGNLNATTTTIGSNGSPSNVRGYNGVFRLSKSLMFSIINGLPITTTGIPAAGAPIGDWTAPGSYYTTAAGPDGTPFNGESTVPLGSTPYDMTQNGKVINPYRFKDASGAVTVGPGTDIARSINGVAMIGGPSGSGNDCRDVDRTAKWTTVADSVFGNYVRSRYNGGSKDSLSESMRNRPLEAQALLYTDADGDTTTDDHEYARPLFIDRATLATTALPTASASVDPVEKPAYELSKALGDGNVMVRKDNPTDAGELPNSSWYIRNTSKGLTDSQHPNLTQPESAGLVIRERMVPDTRYWPGSLPNVPVVSPSSTRYVPYAYGKQWYPSTLPFSVCDVSDNLLWGYAYYGGNLYNINYSSGAPRFSAYEPGGSLTMAAACYPGPSWVSGVQRNGQWNGYNNNTYYGISNKQYFYRDPWRFMHLGMPKVGTVSGQLKVTSYNSDAPYFNETASTPVAYGLPFSDLAPIGPTAVAITNGQLALPVSPAPATSGWRSYRWSGFLMPSGVGTSSYVLSFASTVDSNLATRVWLNGTVVLEANIGSAISSYWNYFAQNTAVPIVIEVASKSTGVLPALPQLRWSVNGGTAVNIPTAQFYLEAAPATFPKANVTYVQCRIQNPQILDVTGPDDQKVGLMIRPDPVISPMLQGGGAYGMIGWSPSRGFFTQRRQVPTTQDFRQQGQIFVGNANNNLDASNPGVATTLTGTVRTGNFTQVATGAVTTEAISYEYGTNPSMTLTTVPNVTIPVGLTVSVGGGKTWTLKTAFTMGSYTGYQVQNPYKRARQRIDQTQTLGMNNYLSLFINADDGYTLNLYADTGALGDSSPTPAASGSVGYSSNGRTWWWSNATGTADNSSTPTAINRRYITRTYTGNYTYGAYVYGATSNGTPSTLGDANTAWPSSGTIYVDKLGVISAATASDLTTIIQANGYSQSVTTLKGSTPSYSNFAAPTSTMPSDASCPAPATPTAPPLLSISAGRTFSLARSVINPCIDSNPWIPAGMTWNSTPVGSYLPRGSGWPGTEFNGTTGGWVASATPAWPTTGALRPDVYIASPTPTSSASTSTSALYGVSTVPVTGATSGGNNYWLKVGTHDIQPSGWNTATEVWLRAQVSGNLVSFYGYAGMIAPTGVPPGNGWTLIGNTLDMTGWTNGQLQIGPCIQSANYSYVTQCTFTDLSVGVTPYVGTQDVNSDGVVDSQDWDRILSGRDDFALYLMSQYQVFFGPYDITEDFFLYRDSTTKRRIASEDWFYNAREFWSQSRWWEHGAAVIPSSTKQVAPTPTWSGAPSIDGLHTYYRLEKDNFTSGYSTFSSIANRKLLAKTTVLSLDMEVMQNYLKARTFQDATADQITGVGPAIPVLTDPGKTLKEAFSGIFYAARSNRYPWNPNSNPKLDTANLTYQNANPYGPLNASYALPNPSSLLGGSQFGPEIDNNKSLSLGTANYKVGTVLVLQPYALDEDAAIKPQDFHHGIRMTHASSIYWGFSGSPTYSGTNGQGGRNFTYPTNPSFGTSKSSFVTPNALYVQGSLNVDQTQVVYKDNPAFKQTPLALMGDSINFLSDGWNDKINQIDALQVTSTGITGSGLLTCATPGPVAKTSYYNAGICTNNQPTTKERVYEGQASPFVDTLLFLENWNGKSMGYSGSLVILDSRRYTKAFLHDAPKSYGTTPFGVSSAAGLLWLNKFQSDYLVKVYRDSYSTPRGSDQWAASSPNVFSEPARSYSFNSDFLMNDGTPPFVPFGVKSTGMGGWTRIIK